MINETQQICKACATGNVTKYNHNKDPKTCVEGREEYIRCLSPEEQIRELISHERLSREMADYIVSLAKARKKSPLEILKEEGIRLG